MKCPRCDRPAEPGQRFCNGCGVRLTFDDGSSILVDDNSESARGESSTIGFDETAEADRPRPSAAPTEPPASPAQPSAGSAVTPPSAMSVVPRIEPDDRPTPTDPPTIDVGYSGWQGPASAPPVTHTAIQPSVPTGTAPRPSAPHTEVIPAQAHSGSSWIERNRFKFKTTTVLGLVAGILMIASIFANVLTIQTDVTVIFDGAEVPEGFRLGSWAFGNLGSNLPIAVLLCGLIVIGGAVAVGFGNKWGGGLAAGGSLAYAGLAALALGLAQIPIEAAKRFALIPTDAPFTLLITRDAGYWSLVAVAALGIVVAFASFNECIADRQRNLNPWFGALGALSVVAVVIGVSVPVNNAYISDNWYVIEGVNQAPPMLVTARLVQIGLFLLAGVVGFLLVRPYGLGLAVGGTVPSLWLGVSVVLSPTNTVGPGWRNPGASQMEVHGITIVAMAALLSLLILACLSAYNQYALGSDPSRSPSRP